MPLRKEFLSNRYLRITYRTELNDPYDYHPFRSDIEEHKERYNALTNGSYVPSDRHLIDNHLNGIGVISFTEAIDNITMWSHYADEHRGIAIGFNPKHSFFNDLQRVRYTRQRPSLRKEFPNIMGTELFFKSDEWAYEKEWRLALSFTKADVLVDKITKEESTQIPIPSIGNNLAMVEVPADAIQSITFGALVKEKEISIFLDALAKDGQLSHISLERISLHIDRYEVNRIPI